MARDNKRERALAEKNRMVKAKDCP
ncbi:MAG: hypothetical protein RJB01_651, partial [Actinomycetota bacterium]